VAKQEDSLQLGPTKVEVTILQSQLLIGLGSVHLERGCRRGIVNGELLDTNLDRAGL
jgi:hypothetical protein